MIEEIAHAATATATGNASDMMALGASVLTFVIAIGTFATLLSKTNSMASRTRVDLEKHQLKHDTDMASIQLELAKVHARTAEIDKDVAVLAVKVGAG